MSDLTFTKPGAVWSEIVNEIEWLQNEWGDQSAAMAEIEDQLGSEYWESEALLTVTVSEGVAELIRQVENTVVTESGIDWGFLVSELEWDLANATDVDGMEALRETIDSQLPDAYWELWGSFDVTLAAEQAQMLDELRTKWADEGR